MCLGRTRRIRVIARERFFVYEFSLGSVVWDGVILGRVFVYYKADWVAFMMLVSGTLDRRYAFHSQTIFWKETERGYWNGWHH